MQTLYSQIDSSVNFIHDSGAESRFVQREPSYFITYLSSHNGCNQACRFCHLTQTKQTEFVSVSEDHYLSQAIPVFEHYDSLNAPAERVNYNFMARGEPLLNDTLQHSGGHVINRLAQLAEDRGLDRSFNISTIFPRDYKGNLIDTFKTTQERVRIYYSLYSMDPSFRRRWLPKAADPQYALEQLARWQDSGREVVLHWAMIEGENDDEETLDNIIAAVDHFGLVAPKFNLVRYNPYDEATSRESDDPVLSYNFNKLQTAFNHPRSRIVPRVGFDVKASCGMFIG